MKRNKAEELKDGLVAGRSALLSEKWARESRLCVEGERRTCMFLLPLGLPPLNGG
jgi:hypothetical protein